MPSNSYLKSEARKIGESTSNPEVAKLAEIVGHLCAVCDDLEQKTKAAMEEARRAKREAKK